MEDKAATAWIKRKLRRVSLEWPPRTEAKKAARTERRENPKTGRLRWHVECAICGADFPEAEAKMDHINPVVSVEKGFTGWQAYVLRLFAPIGNWQVLCATCHDGKTKNEGERRRAHGTYK